MTDLHALVQDLRAHAPEAPPHCAQLMRDAAAIVDRFKHLMGVALLDDGEVRGAPIEPPDLGGKHRRPKQDAPCG